MPRISESLRFIAQGYASHTPKLNPSNSIPKHWQIKNRSIHFNTSTKLENLSPIQKTTTFSRNILPETCRRHFPTNFGHCHVSTSCHQSLTNRNNISQTLIQLLVEPTHAKNTIQSNWIISPRIRVKIKVFETTNPSNIYATKYT